MRIDNEQVQISATDLAKHLACRHLTMLDLRQARGEIKRPFQNDPGLDALALRGAQHEAEYLAHLRSRGLEVLEPEAGGFQRTLDAMKSGVEVVAQADLEDGRWRGRADALLKVQTPSNLGSWSYEVVDTKLARETKGGTILQLCLYSELIEKIQGYRPQQMHVVTPGREFQPETFRLHDYLAYYRFVKGRLETEVTAAGTEARPIMQAVTYPEPVEHCAVCEWWPHCNERRRNDDHLSFVAGVSKLQTGELRKWGVTTLANLATIPLPLKNRPERGSAEGYTKIREQARLQLEYRTNGKPVYELFDLEAERGLARLPEPSPGDIFLDFEGDPFVEEGGIEYLLGYAALNEKGEMNYMSSWALNRADEREAFESFIDMVTDRLSRFPDLHIYHFSAYEPTALKRLMGRYAAREDEMDRLLRAGVFVDLYRIIKQALRASVETYSLKDLEVFFRFERKTDLREASRSLRSMECALELNDAGSLPSEILQTVESYNREDCLSTLQLRDWLEGIRNELVRGGKKIQRPVPKTGDPSEKVDERRQQVLAIMERLLHNVPSAFSERTPEQQATWLLAHMLEWHRREDKASWWEYYRLLGLTDEELLEERAAISGLEFVTRIGGTANCPIDRYRFPQQDTEAREGNDLETRAGNFGKVQAIDIGDCTVDVKKTGAMAEIHPGSAFVFNRIDPKEPAKSLLRLGTWVADHGIDAVGPYRAARDLLLRRHPRLKPGNPAELYRSDADIVDEAKRLTLQLDHGVLPIQGPPGAGKTFTGARMICELLRQNKTIGITAVSHKVIRKLLEEVLKAAEEEQLTVRCIEKVKDLSAIQNPAINETKENEDVVAALQDGEAQLAGGTAWLWARPEYAKAVDVLFVDEAGQMSLASVLAASQAAGSIVLLGDPQQLEQPLQGTHPPGVAVSSLQHILGNEETMPPNSGLFLSETWRLSPEICQFTSELFYDNRLNSRKGLNRQKLTGATRFEGSGLWFVPVNHEGNQNKSDEEADAVAAIVNGLIQPNVNWMDQNNRSRPIGWNDILIVTPYNAQIFNMAERLPQARIGTVDKFQGQEAPVVIYSMATSSPEEAPHGMEFLYSLNRFNVATSRARCVCILVANPRLFEPDCKTPRQMKLANALCRYREMARIVEGPATDRRKPAKTLCILFGFLSSAYLLLLLFFALCFEYGWYRVF